jgi:hypothetical protein
MSCTARAAPDVDQHIYLRRTQQPDQLVLRRRPVPHREQRGRPVLVDAGSAGTAPPQRAHTGAGGPPDRTVRVTDPIQPADSIPALDRTASRPGRTPPHQPRRPPRGCGTREATSSCAAAPSTTRHPGRAGPPPRCSPASRTGRTGGRTGPGTAAGHQSTGYSRRTSRSCPHRAGPAPDRSRRARYGPHRAPADAVPGRQPCTGLVNVYALIWSTRAQRCCSSSPCIEARSTVRCMMQVRSAT